MFVYVTVIWLYFCTIYLLYLYFVCFGKPQQILYTVPSYAKAIKKGKRNIWSRCSFSDRRLRPDCVRQHPKDNLQVVLRAGCTQAAPWKRILWWTAATKSLQDATHSQTSGGLQAWLPLPTPSSHHDKDSVADDINICSITRQGRIPSLSSAHISVLWQHWW